MVKVLTCKARQEQEHGAEAIEIQPGVAQQMVARPPTLISEAEVPFHHDDVLYRSTSGRSCPVPLVIMVEEYEPSETEANQSSDD